MIPPGFHRPRRGEVCPICGKPDYCLIGDDRTRVLCPRVASENRWGDAGWLHVIGETKPSSLQRPQPVEPRFIDCDAVLQRYMLDSTTPRYEQLAKTLGVSIESLKRLGAVWSVRYDAWAFPMKDAAGKVNGIRYRTMDGKKFAMRGAGDGCFIPSGLAGDLLLLPEGPTDTAAVLSIGLPAIGRPNNANGGRIIRAMIFQLRIRDVVIIADRDEPGLQGAAVCAAAIGRAVRIMSPPKHKDIREWINAGATADLIRSVVRSMPCKLHRAG